VWIAFGLLLPLVLVAVICAFDQRLRALPGPIGERLPEIAVILGAVWAFVAMSVLIAAGNRFPHTTQIAWTGFDKTLSTASRDVTIGGNEQDAAVGWPNGSFDPMVRLTPDGRGGASLLLGKGGAFVISTATNEILNGLPIAEGDSGTIGGYRFELVRVDRWILPLLFVAIALLAGAYVVVRSKARAIAFVAAGIVIALWRWFSVPYRLEIRAPDHTLVADAALTRPTVLDRVHFISLEYLNGRSSKDAKRNAVYQNWSRSVLIAVTRNGIRVLDRDSVFRAACELPCTLSLKWRRGSLRTTIAIDAAERAHVNFERPWRRVSPIPEATKSGREIIVTREAQPNDYAFLLPLGGGRGDPRRVLRIDDEHGPPRFTTGVSLPPPNSVRGRSDDGRVVTSEALVDSGPYRFRLVTSVDILHPDVIVWRLFVALLGVVAGIVLLSANVRRETRWLCDGIAVALFALLSFRVALAVRYAAAPEYIDQIAIKGIVLSLAAVTALPSLLLLEARVRHDAVNRSMNRQGMQRTWRFVALFLAFIGAATLFQLGVAGSMWPAVPRAIVPDWKFSLGVALILALFALHILFAAWRAYLARGANLRPRVSYENFAEATARFWRSVAEPRRRNSLNWYLAVLGAAGVFLAGLFILHYMPFKRVLQEVGAPLILTLLPALLWLSAAVYMRFNKRNGSQNKLPPRRLFFWAFVTVFVPAVMIPFFIGDPGSLLATAAVFFPVGLVLLISDGGRKAAIAVLTALLFAWGTALVAYVNWENLYTTATKLTGGGNVPARLLVFKREAGVQQDILRTSQSLQDAYQHTWQNKAIAHGGGWTGLGYGLAPTRRSHVAQDTLQFDSVFSFFVFSEHGAAGAFALILVYAVPIVFYLLTSRRFTLSMALGLVIVSAFFCEAWFHAAMNLGIWPFAGRNLPLLSVNSGTDVVKWLCLFTVMMSTPFWRSNVQSRNEASTDEATIVSVSRRRTFVLAYSIAAALLFASIVYGGAHDVLDARLSQPFTWDPILQTTQRLIADGKLTLDKNNRLTAAADEAREDSLLAHEIEAFNQLPLDQQTGDSTPSQFLGKLFSVTNVSTYERVLRSEGTQQFDQVKPRPSLFRLVPLPKYADEDGLILVVGPKYRVEPNPEFNTRVSFLGSESRDEIPHIIFSQQQAGSFILQGSAFTINVPRAFHTPYQNRRILLAASSPDLAVASDQNATLSRGDILLRLKSTRGWMDHPFVRFEVSENGLLYLDNSPGGFQLRINRGAQELKVIRGQRVQLVSGDHVAVAFDIGVDPSFSVAEREPAPIVGPAWVMGHWTSAFDHSSALPWTPYLATALEREWVRLGPAAASAKYRSLTFDLDLQRNAQETVSFQGRSLHEAKLARFDEYRKRFRGAPSSRLLHFLAPSTYPPRVALAAITLPDAEVVAMAGWPRMMAGRIGGPCTSHDEWCPPTAWIDRSAPSFVRSRYGADRNFDRIEMGSSTKPIVAAAALTVHPRIDEQLHVTGPDGVEQEVFGIPITGRTGWHISHGTSSWVGFREFLSRSDNRYEVRLGFASLAEANRGDVKVDAGMSPSVLESMDGHSPWHHYPLFPPDMLFSQRLPERMQRIDDSPFAQTLRAMFAIGVRQGDYRPRRYSFWTADGKDDAVPTITTAGAPPANQMGHEWDAISPEIPDLAFDYITNPRQYVSLLLGGNENRWSNVDFASAFATAVTGHPVIGHVLKIDKLPAPPADRPVFPAIAARLRPGLHDVITSGTAATAQKFLLPPAITKIGDVSVYAKTGTLAVAEGNQTTSRLVIAYVRWADEAKGLVKKGIVLSFVAQEAKQGDATRWLGEYITENQTRIAAYLQ
jgi:hypothetical protein